ncbi:MAG: hypothetical protein C4523_02535 [Myxococcales bacterium]|nr:MAG: hypothetical protein C4523_02535 [Myxococcales bacterium]
MSRREVVYPVASKGMATAYAEAELPIDYAAYIRNRFLNAAGGYEKREGISQLGSTISGSPTLTGVHELIKSDGTAILFVSGNGKIYKYDDVSAWSQVYAFENTTAHVHAVQFDKRLIFCNGSNRDIYTEDGTTFKELVPLIEIGKTTSGTNETGLHDSDITNWISATDVAVNDLVYNVTRGGYGIVTAVTTASVSHTRIAPNGTGIGIVAATASAGDAYEIHDLVELNIIPVGNDLDNTAILTSGASATVVAVSGVNFSTTEVRAGDIIYNSTRNAATQVVTASANLVVTSVAGQTSGDTITLHKSAMPISTIMHVHYGRLYHLDARDKKKIRISGANDPQDMTSDAGTLDSISFNVGALQPFGDTIQNMASFQRFFVIAGKHNIFAYTGTTPIGTGADFSPVGLFPQGLVAEHGLVSLGNDVAIVTHDGIQALSVIDDSSNLNRANISEAIRPTLRKEINATNPDNIWAVHYPQRSWLLLKVGSLLYCYTYSTVGRDKQGRPIPGGWTVFDGPFAQQRAYYVRQNGDLICCGTGGKVYEFDTGIYSDDSRTIPTEYRTGWLDLEEPKLTNRIKQGTYIKPVIDAASTVYTIRAESPYDFESSDVIEISATGASSPIGVAVIGETIIGGSSVQNEKYSLRWRGESVRLTFTTDDANGPDTLSRFSLYVNVLGRE